MATKLKDLIRDLKNPTVYGSTNSLITSITNDSRKVKKGALFVAIKGSHYDGHDYIKKAILKGAVGIIGEKRLSNLKVTYIRVSNSRRALSLIASLWYGKPSQKLKMIGVTGTDGKTTTSNFIYYILTASGKRTGLISSINARIGSKVHDTGFHVTNPEPQDLQRLLNLMVKRGCEYCVLEVTSHGLDQERVEGIKFAASVITNVTPEHLDYHKTYKNYLKSKAKLFSHTKQSVLNKDDSSFNLLKKLIPTGYIYYSVKENFLLPKTLKVIQKNFPGLYNLQNALAAATVCRIFGVNNNQIHQGFSQMKELEGRLQKVYQNSFTVIVDFAHTPNALKNVLELIKSDIKGRLIAVFGCAGERDKKKRQKMGEISTRISDISVFTAEDPRTEDINKILDEMENGAQKALNSNSDLTKHSYFKIAERGEAISFAIQKLARKGDVVVICGKGHEKSMAYDEVEYPWSDQEAVKIALYGGVKKIIRNGHKQS